MLDSLNNWLLAVVGLVLLAILVLSANFAVKKLVGIANYFHLSSTFIGMTVLSVATSLPEITSHVLASIGILRGTMDYRIGSAIVLGSNIGSDVVQQTLILGLVVLLAGSLYFRRYFLWKSLGPMIATSALCLVLGIDGSFSRIDGFILFSAFVGYCYFLYVDERKYYKAEDNVVKSDELTEDLPKNRRELVRDVAITFLMVGILIVVATLVLSITELIVVRTGIGGSLIGVLTLGLASALPELSAALAGVRHKEFGVSLGTLVGSNITNPLVGIGGGALISTYAVPKPLVGWDLPWATLTGLLLWIILWRSNGKLGKFQAIYLMVMYFVYIFFRSTFFPIDY